MTYRWCEQQLESYGCRVILLTNDKKNKEKALASKLLACTGDTKFQKWLFVTHTLFMLEVQEYASSLPAWPELLDLTSSGDMYDGVRKDYVIDCSCIDLVIYRVTAG
jgi:hypothetical protein